MSLYCKKCGRQLRPEARFCDRCGFVIKKESAKTSSSAKKGSNYKSKADRIREEKKRKKNNGGKIILLFLIAILLGIISSTVAYNIMSSQTNKGAQPTENNVMKLNQTDENTDTANDADEITVSDSDTEHETENTPKPSKKPAKEDTDDEADKDSNQDEDKKNKSLDDFDIADKCETYSGDQLNGIKCPYPGDFVQSSKANEDTIISLEDSLNDGYMKICSVEVGSKNTASKIMNEYTDGIGVELDYSDSGDGWYEVSFTRNNRYNHRKAIITDGTCVYYDFSYDTDSEEKSTYDEYIEYFDYYLDEELANKKSSEQD